MRSPTLTKPAILNELERRMTGQQLDQLLQQCTVRLTTGTAQGTGFFVAPGLILTCAHVVDTAGDRPITVEWLAEHRQSTAKVVKLLPDPNLDLALLELIEDLPNHPCVYLDWSTPRLDDRLFSFGYPEDNPDGDSVTSGYEGESFRGNSSLHKLKQGQFNYGSSGSPLLNRRTARVCGIVNISRNTTTDLGARAVPSREILMQLPALIELQQQFHQTDWRWMITALNLRQLVIWQTIGGAVGAGLALGTLRAAIAPLVYRLPPVQFVNNFWAAAVLGAALALGLALAQAIEQRPRKSISGWAIGLGTVLFGTAHMLLAFGNGSFLTETPLVAPMGFVAGLGLSLVLYDQPWLRLVTAEINPSKNAPVNLSQLQTDRCWLRFTLSALVFAIIQGGFILAGGSGTGLAIAWTSRLYEADLSRYGSVVWWRELMERYVHWADYLALIDAALVGVCLSAGIATGLLLANTWLIKQRLLTNQ